MPLLSAFKRQCHEAPDNVAFIDGERRLTYRQVEQQAQRLSAHLPAPRQSSCRVVIALDRGIDAAVAILAVLGMGACYIPLDLKNPTSRLNHILADAAPHCIVGKGPRPDWLESPASWLDIELPEASTMPENWVVATDEELLAAILYTSGSTGTPKGVALSRRALRNFTDWASGAFRLNRQDRIASLAPFHFDLSVFDLFSGLSTGATVDFVPAGLTLSPSRLTHWLRVERISVFYTVPSLLGFIALKGSLDTMPMPDLKTVLFAGEVFPTFQLKKLCALLPQVDFYNLYGPTETNVCLYWPVDRERLRNDQPIPIGRPACGATLKIDPNNGELWVQSANNLSGYWQQGRLTDASSSEGYFRTGDRVSVNERGEYCYHGRLDRMLKCAGYRVEPAEVEAAIMQAPGVAGCAVVGVADPTCGCRPAAAVVLQRGSKLDTVVKMVKQRLPSYMHPSKFAVVESLPYLSNGKTDYQNLSRLLENI